MSYSAIETKGLVKRYKSTDTLALNHLDLSIPEHSIYGLLGPNGAGKTTTISILCGLLKPDKGRVTIGGMDLESEKKNIQQLLGIVPQEIALFPTLTVRENLHYLGEIYRIPKNILPDKVRELINAFGLNEKKDVSVEKLSGGMRRRVNLMAGILHDPKILILDEPTVGIDVHSRGMITDHLLRLREQGTTLLYTSHDLEEAEKLCDAVSIMDRGKVVHQGTPTELIKETRNPEGTLRDLLLELGGKSSEK